MIKVLPTTTIVIMLQYMSPSNQRITDLYNVVCQLHHNCFLSHLLTPTQVILMRTVPLHTQRKDALWNGVSPPPLPHPLADLNAAREMGVNQKYLSTNEPGLLQVWRQRTASWAPLCKLRTITILSQPHKRSTSEYNSEINSPERIRGYSYPLGFFLFFPSSANRRELHLSHYISCLGPRLFLMALECLPDNAGTTTWKPWKS